MKLSVRAKDSQSLLFLAPVISLLIHPRLECSSVRYLPLYGAFSRRLLIVSPLHCQAQVLMLGLKMSISCLIIFPLSSASSLSLHVSLNDILLSASLHSIFVSDV